MGVLANIVTLLSTGVGTTFQRWRRGPLRPGWSWKYEATVAFLRATHQRLEGLEAPAHRAVMESLALSTPALRAVRREPVDAGGVPGVWFIPPKAGEGAVLFLHGGAYVFGSTRTHGDLMARLALASGMRVLGIDYRLAPEHPFPSALEDAVKAWRWLLSTGVSPRRAVLAGDSAGGGLSLATLVVLRGRGEPMPAGAALISPWVDLAATGESHTRHARYDWIVRGVAERWTQWCLGGASPEDPLASPLYADLHALPPLYIQLGGVELLHDEVTRLAQKVREAGGAVELDVWPEMVHDWQLFDASIPESQRAVEKLGERIQAFTRAEPKLAVVGASSTGS
jgi:acetyl esterase/lipase